MNVNDSSEGRGEAVPFVEGGEDLVGGNGAELDALVGHGFEAALELGSAIGEGGLGAIGPGRPGKGLRELRVVVFEALGEVDVAGEVRGFVPFSE